MGKFSSEFILKCHKDGITQRDDIISFVKSRISEIDIKLLDADNLRIEKLQLREVLADLGDDSVKRKRQDPEAPALDIDDNSDDAKELRQTICKVIEEFGSLTNREINQKIGQYQNDIKVIYALKYLATKQIIQRDGTSENKIVQGPNWSDRE